tara:strand:- start:369 stop:1064 length:696 start_codon:yes stop_codon:yes gene_type:complete
MRINLLSLSDGAKTARGIVVIIDVFRAYTTQSFAFEKGVRSIINVADINQAIEYKNKKLGDMCMGEIDGKRPSGFDFGNSPYDLAKTDISDKTLIHCTMNGTTGAELAQNASMILGGALINAQATADYIKKLSPQEVSLVSMGSRSTDNIERRTEEDELCAIYLKSILDDSPVDSNSIVDIINSCKESKKFGDPLQPHYPKFDKQQAFRINEFNHPIVISKENDILFSKIV